MWDGLMWIEKQAKISKPDEEQKITCAKIKYYFYDESVLYLSPPTYINSLRFGFYLKSAIISKDCN